MRVHSKSSVPVIAEIWKKERKYNRFTRLFKKGLAIQSDSVIIDMFDIRNSTKHIKEF